MSEQLPDLQTYFPNTPERAVADFLHAWAAEDWRRVLKATQIDWRSRAGNNADWIKEAYGFRMLHKAEILSCEAGKLNIETGAITPAVIGDAVIAKVCIAVWTSSRTSRKNRKEIEATVLKESGPMQPDSKGTWGVNPISMLRGLSVVRHDKEMRRIRGHGRKS